MTNPQPPDPAKSAEPARPTDPFESWKWYQRFKIDSDSWREAALADIAELRARAAYWSQQPTTPPNVSTQPLINEIEQTLNNAEEAARYPAVLSGTAAERAREQIDAARLLLFQAAPETELPGLGREALALARQHLGVSDPRRSQLEELLDPKGPNDLLPAQKDIAISAMRAALAAAGTEQYQARSFRLVLRATFWLLVAVAVALVVFGALRPRVLQLCFHKDEAATHPIFICAGSEHVPNGYDIFIVELIGVAAAALTASFVLRRLDGTATAYSIPFALALVKLPSGAISAFIGVIFLGAGIIPGIGEIVTREEVYAWAAIFGAGQQVVTRLIDIKGREVLGNIRGADRTRGDQSPDS
ncbi:hypothetical protein [Streptomyces nigra]|uniref:hypothetical protein n=1 Tax=Streptomyces nigra TaxID=1827580 RepID=UPI00368B2E44